jgi:hypothetical protein
MLPWRKNMWTNGDQRGWIEVLNPCGSLTEKSSPFVKLFFSPWTISQALHLRRFNAISALHSMYHDLSDGILAVLNHALSSVTGS